jgi:hypothetical protein
MKGFIATVLIAVSIATYGQNLSKKEKEILKLIDKNYNESLTFL